MLKERYSFSNDDNKVEIVTVDEILESYDIKGLTLEELQEKYVNMYDMFEEKTNNLDQKYENLEETIVNLKSTIEGKEFNNSNKHSNNSFELIFFLIYTILIFFIAFFISKFFYKNTK